MSISIAFPVLIFIVFLAWLILSLIRDDVKASQFWWNLLIALAVLATFGIHSLNP